MEMLTPRVTKRQTLADGIMAMSHRSYAPVASRSGNTGGRHALALQGLPRRALGDSRGFIFLAANLLNFSFFPSKLKIYKIIVSLFCWHFLEMSAEYSDFRQLCGISRNSGEFTSTSRRKNESLILIPECFFVWWILFEALPVAYVGYN